ncbi:DEAD/DEAH box helicase [Humidisolicoccus flavus]|uniref:DEAD/DEAH box helicase n=1 Tax=Humidisolicoccus flavus TaxID=3111414 RepID=UPI003245B35E
MTESQTSDATLTFAELGVPARLVQALAGMDRHTPFPIQADTLPDTLAGRDVLGRGKTGSGKTLAFAIPMVARLSDSSRSRAGSPRGLVLAPTRELATQITASIEPLAKAAGLSITTIFGGVSQRPQEQAFARGVDIVVACPGRLDDLMKQGIVKLDRVEITVLDEADHMADLGFLPIVTRILQKTPAGGQRLLFSATLDNGVDVLVKKFLRDEVLHSVDEANSPVAAMTHHVFEVHAEEKTELIKALASGMSRRILFTRTKHQAKKLAKQLTASGIPAVDLHGNLSQNARDRNLAAFSDGSVKVLVATDVAARGVHVDDVGLVVHVDPPMEHKAYLHRSGRTARAGSAGDVATIMLPAQRKDTQALLRKAQIAVTPQSVTADAAPIVALVGQVAPRVAPSEAPVVAQPQPRQPRGNGGGGRGRSGGGRSQGGARSQGGRSGEGRAATTGASTGGQSRGGARTAAPRNAGPQQRSTGGGRSAGAGAAPGGSRRARRPQGR